MNGQQRRGMILQILEQSSQPVSGTVLANMLGVSRQVIVQDMALLRSGSGPEILSTHRGYVLHRPQKPCSRVFKVRHPADRTEQELLEIVDLGGTVEDVFVYHSVYGVVRGQLQIASRQDVREFMERLARSSSAPLMHITDDFHYHTVTARRDEPLDRIGDRLRELDFLAPLREHEPEELLPHRT